MSKEIKYYYDNLLDYNKPIIFSDGTKVYEDLKEKYVTHTKGYFIYGPSGVGKSHFINNQKEKNWIDGDILWEATGAFPKGDWWNWPIDDIDCIERRADIITEQAKKLGFWIIGASSVNMIPDAIVIPDFETHLEYIKHRENNNYDGGLTSEDLDKIKNTRKYYSRFKKNGVPIFKSVDEAVSYIVNQKDN